jgi:hypothetical protein
MVTDDIEPRPLELLELRVAQSPSKAEQWKSQWPPLV